MSVSKAKEYCVSRGYIGFEYGGDGMPQAYQYIVDQEMVQQKVSLVLLMTAMRSFFCAERCACKTLIDDALHHRKRLANALL